MQPRDWRLRLEDILEAVARIESYTSDTTYEAFAADRKTIDAVVRNVTVIGEAARHLPDEMKERYPEIPWDEMRRIRNAVVHEYFGVSVPLLWRTAVGDLPPLTAMLTKILKGES